MKRCANQARSCVWSSGVWIVCFFFFILFVLEVTSEGFGLIDSSGQKCPAYSSSSISLTPLTLRYYVVLCVTARSRKGFVLFLSVSQPMDHSTGTSPSADTHTCCYEQNGTAVSDRTGRQHITDLGLLSFSVMKKKTPHTFAHLCPAPRPLIVFQ